MKLTMPLNQYVDFLREFSNVPLSLNRLTLPFGIITDSKDSDTLLVGHVLDDIASRFEEDQSVDCIDVIAAAYELGHDCAESYLEKVPYLMCKMAVAFGGAHIH